MFSGVILGTNMGEVQRTLSQLALNLIQGTVGEILSSSAFLGQPHAVGSKNATWM